MNFARSIEPEILDSMTADDPRAIRARRDLKRVNMIMGHTSIWRKILAEKIQARTLPLTIVELGCGDGTLLLPQLRTFGTRWPRTRLLFIDRHPSVQIDTLDKYAAHDWQANIIQADIFDWISNMPRVDLVMSNLVLHHFNNSQLRKLFRILAEKTCLFVACEPRRSQLALLGSHMLGLVGCGPVTRHDAVVSVRAGFSGKELSELWPEKGNWQLQEKSAGLFSHLFIAQS